MCGAQFPARGPALPGGALCTWSGAPQAPGSPVRLSDPPPCPPALARARPPSPQCALRGWRGKVTPGRGSSRLCPAPPSLARLHLPPLGAPRRCGRGSGPCLSLQPGFRLPGCVPVGGLNHLKPDRCQRCYEPGLGGPGGAGGRPGAVRGGSNRSRPRATMSGCDPATGDSPS